MTAHTKRALCVLPPGRGGRLTGCARSRPPARLPARLPTRLPAQARSHHIHTTHAAQAPCHCLFPATSRSCSCCPFWKPTPPTTCARRSSHRSPCPSPSCKITPSRLSVFHHPLRPSSPPPPTHTPPPPTQARHGRRSAEPRPTGPGTSRVDRGGRRARFGRPVWPHARARRG